MRIGSRLILSFLVIVLVVVGVSGFSILKMQELANLTANLYRHPYAVSTAALRVHDGITAMHRSMKDVALANSEEQIVAASSVVAGYQRDVLADFDIILERFLGDKAQIETARQEFVNWEPIRNDVIQHMRNGERAQAADITRGRGAEHIEVLFGHVEGIIDFAENKAAEFNTGAEATRVATIQLTVVIVAVSVLLSILLAIVLTRSVTQPLSALTAIAAEVQTGSFDVDLSKEASKDELGSLTESFYSIVQFLQKKADVVDSVAGGDLSVDATAAGESDVLGNGLNTMTTNLNRLMAQVKDAAEQVSQASGQVTDSSHQLSDGATSQASSLQEISASINQVNGQSRQNADNSTEANHIARQAATTARSGNDQMSSLREAMERISHSSDQIKKVVKVIDDIAFQINLLALNANVEAARAGKYGKGFAVVAEEVRNLAARSGEAVQETTAMVEESVRNIEVGNQLTDDTARQLEEIVTGSEQVAQFLDEISAASKEQAQAIDEITEGLTRVDQVTQENTASAQQSAAAAEQLGQQATRLHQSISRFTLSEQALAGAAHGLIAERPRQNQSEPSPRPNPRRNPQPVLASGASEAIQLDDDDMSRF